MQNIFHRPFSQWLFHWIFFVMLSGMLSACTNIPTANTASYNYAPRAYVAPAELSVVTSMTLEDY